MNISNTITDFPIFFGMFMLTDISDLSSTVHYIDRPIVI